MAHFVNPVVSETGEYLGSNIESHSEGLWKQDQGYVQLQDGRHVNAFADAELESDSYDESGFDFEEYSDQLASLHSSLPAAIAWASEGHAPGFDAVGLNAAVEAQDLTAVNQYIEQLVAMYEADTQTADRPSVDERSNESFDDIEEDEDAPTEIDQDYVNTEVERLRSAEFTDAQVDFMSEAASMFPDTSAESYILNLGANIGRGEMTFDEALQYASQYFTNEQLITAYQRLQNTLN